MIQLPVMSTSHPNKNDPAKIPIAVFGPYSHNRLELSDAGSTKDIKKRL